MATHQSFRPAVLRDTRDVASDVRLFSIEPEHGLSSYQVGSHIDIQVMVNERPEYRSFSLVDGGQTEGGVYRIAVKDRPDGHGGSRYLWSLEPGARVMISEPKDRFPLSHRGQEYLLVAGGIGITPIYGMARALVARGVDVRVLYAARTQEQLAFAAELQELLGDRLKLFVTGEGQRMEAAAEIAELGEDAELYICGPLSLREDFLREWLAAGRSQSKFRFETFASSGKYPDQPFDVRIANRDVAIRVEKDQSLLQALQVNGINEVLYDCEHGECGLCTVDVLDYSGKLDHRDVFYSDRQKEANNRICTCVSRVYDGDLVIDTSRHRVDTGRADP
jgi:vanillate O-demethylase ferredoxin subunit